MEQKQILVSAGIAALTSVVVFFLLYFTVGSAMFAPPTSPIAIDRTFVNAHACDTDGVCEIGSAEIDGYINVEVDIEAELVNAVEVKTGIAVAAEMIVSKSASQQVRINPFVEHAIVVTTFSGNDSAYACISSQGGFYRSQTPCA